MEIVQCEPLCATNLLRLAWGPRCCPRNARRATLHAKSLDIPTANEVRMLQGDVATYSYPLKRVGADGPLATNPRNTLQALMPWCHRRALCGAVLSTPRREESTDEPSRPRQQSSPAQATGCRGSFRGRMELPMTQGCVSSPLMSKVDSQALVPTEETRRRNRRPHFPAGVDDGGTPGQKTSRRGTTVALVSLKNITGSSARLLSVASPPGDDAALSHSHRDSDASLRSPRSCGAKHCGPSPSRSSTTKTADVPTLGRQTVTFTTPARPLREAVV